jgi:hypothetical protein
VKLFEGISKEILLMNIETLLKIILTPALLLLISGTIALGQGTELQVRYRIVNLGAVATCNQILNSHSVVGSHNPGGDQRHATFGRSLRGFQRESGHGLDSSSVLGQQFKPRGVSETEPRVSERVSRGNTTGDRWSGSVIIATFQLIMASWSDPKSPGIHLNSVIPAGSGYDVVVARRINNGGEIAGGALFDGQIPGHAVVLVPVY